MKRAYEENGVIKHADMKEADLSLLSEKAQEVLSLSSFDIAIDREGTYYFAASQGQNFSKIGDLKELDECLEAYAEKEGI